MTNDNWEGQLLQDFTSLVNEFMDDVSDMSADDFKSNLFRFKKYINDEYITDNIKDLYSKLDNDELDNMLIDQFDVEDLPNFLDDENHGWRNQPDLEFLKQIGNLLIKAEFEYDHKSDPRMVLFAMSLSNEKYDKQFKSEIGLEFNETSKVWYMRSSFLDIGEFFTETYDFEDHDAERWYGDYSAYDTHSDEINIGNLMTLAYYFKSKGFDIDTNPLEKFKSDEYKNENGYFYIGYKDSKEIYINEGDIRSILSTVNDIINDNYDYDFDNNPYDDIEIDGIQRAINNAYGDADADARASEYWNDQINIIGYALLESWPNDGGFDDRNYLKWSEELNKKGENDLIIIPNLDGMLYNDEFFGSIIEYTGNEFDISDIIDAYQENEGKLDWAEDHGYASWDDDNYDVYNERLGEQLSEENIKIDEEEPVITESIIKFSNFK